MKKKTFLNFLIEQLETQAGEDTDFIDPEEDLDDFEVAKKQPISQIEKDVLAQTKAVKRIDIAMR